jgi:hypothetical protein
MRTSLISVDRLVDLGRSGIGLRGMTAPRILASDGTPKGMKNPHWGVKPMSFVLDDLIISHLRRHRDQVMRNVSRYSAHADESNR